MFEIRRAKASDVNAITLLVKRYAGQSKLLPRSSRDVKKYVSTFFVAVENGKLIGCASLDIYSRKMAEIRSLAVDESETGKGIGAALVDACLQKAKKRKVLEVMVVTSADSFFRKLGFDYTLPGERKALFFKP